MPFPTSMMRKTVTVKIFLLKTWKSASLHLGRVVSVLTRFVISDYAPNELLGRYSDADINDDEDVEELSATARRAAEIKMARRDRLERGGKRGARAARRSRMHFLDSDGAEDEDAMDGGLGVSKMKRRTRRQYDERRDMDDLEGIEDVCDLEQVLSLYI